MRLPGDEVRQVLAGKRTVLIVPPTKRPYQVGRSIAVHLAKPTGDETAPVARVTVTNVEQSALHDVDYRTMQRAGFRYREDLHAWWLEKYRQDPGPPEEPRQVPVVIVRFQLDRAIARRYLRPGPRGGYAEAADDEVPRGVMSDEPECVPKVWQERISADLRARDLDEARRRREALKTVPLPTRLAGLMERARRGQVDISRQLAIIAKRVEAIERIVDDEAA